MLFRPIKGKMRSKKLLIAILVMVILSGCTRTISYPQMRSNQAELVRSNWENIKIGMSKEEVTHLLGPPTVHRIYSPQKKEKLWYIFTSIKDTNTNFFIYVIFSDGVLVEKRIE